jgi:SAM-dependent methyltransferase
MHISALHYGKAFFETYTSSLSSSNLLIVDVGSQDVNGSLRQFAPLGSQYIGVDFETAAGVDVVLTDPYKLPFDTGSVDVIVCSSVYEHSEFFWLLFLETLRVLKPSGILYLNAPSNGAMHRYPIDAWRFYPDSGKSLTNWARRNGMPAVLLESFIGTKRGELSGDGMWNDFVAVVLRDENHLPPIKCRMIDREPMVHFAYQHNSDTPLAKIEFTPDLLLINELAKQKAELVTEANDLEKQVEALRTEIALIHSSTSWRYTAFLRWIGGIVRLARKS